jgi:stage II sporulation protein D
MGRLKLLFLLSLCFINTLVFAQVKVRLLSNRFSGSAVFTVTTGNYELNTSGNKTYILSKGESAIISKFNGKLAVKTRDAKGFISDSVFFTGVTGKDYFSLRLNGKIQEKRYYSGDLQCFPDMETIVMINICDIEKYIAGVVMAEGGNGKNKEYFKTQAVIVRTYMYKNFNEHLSDRYNVCDNTHCQVFNGVSTNDLITRAALETKGLVLLDSDSILIVSTFHSNCGGETASSEDVWLVSQPYLKKVVDPYCLNSRNAVWEKHIGLNEWVKIINNSGYKGEVNNPSAFEFFQGTRVTDYRTGSFTMPLMTIRNELNLRSTFFSVVHQVDTIILKGRGYGHGVGLCQEGAMAMAAKGFTYQQIIEFYYSGVMISDIKNAIILPHILPSNPPEGGLAKGF